MSLLLFIPSGSRVMTREVQFDVGSYPGFVLHLQHFGTHQRQFILHSEENHQDCHFCQYFLLVVSKLLSLKMHMQTSVRSGYTDPFVVMCVAVSKGSFCVLFGGLLLFPYRGRWDFFFPPNFERDGLAHLTGWGRQDWLPATKPTV